MIVASDSYCGIKMELISTLVSCVIMFVGLEVIGQHEREDLPKSL